MFDPTTWAWPQWAYLVIIAFNLSASAILHGKPQTGEHSFPMRSVGTGIGLFILAFGGFFGSRL